MMRGIIDLCGIPLDLSKIKNFKLCHVEYIYQPAYCETEGTKKRLFGKATKNVTFYRMEPYGVSLGDYGTVDLMKYYPQTKKVTKQAISIKMRHEEKAIGKNGKKRADNKSYLICRRSGSLETNRLCDIPNKIYYTDGHVADVPQDSDVLVGLDTPASSAIVDVQALCIMGKTPTVIYGNGIDVDDVQEIYDYLLCLMHQNVHKVNDSTPEKAKIITMPKVNFPKLQFRSLVSFGKLTKHAALPAVEQDGNQLPSIIVEEDK